MLNGLDKSLNSVDKLLSDWTLIITCDNDLASSQLFY